jgi:hypothetical protein
MGLLDDIRTGAYRPSASPGGPRPSAQPTQTLAAVARRAAEGQDFRLAVREFLDEFALVSEGGRPRMLHEELRRRATSATTRSSARWRSTLPSGTASRPRRGLATRGGSSTASGSSARPGFRAISLS